MVGREHLLNLRADENTEVTAITHRSHSIPFRCLVSVEKLPFIQIVLKHPLAAYKNEKYETEITINLK